jgi:hypothetical protein
MIFEIENSFCSENGNGDGVGWILFVKDLFKDWRKANKAI